ncbi:unnamed protein product [Staurois parvus]|uniref:Uncharacterized protein n=1 Tax=Staurois parvus TaxID=386267 RepID=A0ABN9F2A2_9NEOB|nr:unnamed protein product [Staurois parvus]
MNVIFCQFQISRRSIPVRPDAHRGRNPEGRRWHWPEDITGNTAGGTSRERRTRQEKNRSWSSAAWYSRV